MHTCQSRVPILAMTVAKRVASSGVHLLLSSASPLWHRWYCVKQAAGVLLVPSPSATSSHCMCGI